MKRALPLNLRLCVAAAITGAIAIVPVASEAQRPVSEARKLVERAGSVKKLNQLPPLFTNETAVGMAVMFGTLTFMQSALVEGMETMVEGMAEGMAEGLSGEPGAAVERAPRDPQATADAEKLKAASGKFKAILQKYGMSSPDLEREPTPAERARFIANGRKMFTEVVNLIEGLPGSSEDMPLKFDKSVQAKLRYRQISAKRVSMINPGKPNEKIEARLEDGAWRIHINELADMVAGRTPAKAGSKIVPKK